MCERYPLSAYGIRFGPIFPAVVCGHGGTAMMLVLAEGGNKGEGRYGWTLAIHLKFMISSSVSQRFIWLLCIVRVSSGKEGG